MFCTYDRRPRGERTKPLDFSGLSGGGEFQAIFDLEDQSGVEIYTGEIEYSN
jgi:hypothetical protein